MLSIEKCYQDAANQQAKYQALIHQFGALRIAGLSTVDLVRCFNPENNSHIHKAITASQQEKNNRASKKIYENIILTFRDIPECGDATIANREGFKKFILDFFVDPITFNVDHEKSNDPFKISTLYENIQSVAAMDLTQLYRATQAFALLHSHNAYNPLALSEHHNILTVQEKLTALGKTTTTPIDTDAIIPDSESFYLELQNTETQKILIPYFIPYLKSNTLTSKPVNMDSMVWQETLDVYNDINRCMGTMYENDPFEIYIGSMIKNVERAQIHSSKKYEAVIDQFRALRRLGLTTEDLTEAFPKLQKAIATSLENQYTTEATRTYHRLKFHVTHFFGQQTEKIRSGIKSSLLKSPIPHPFHHVTFAIQDFSNATNQEKSITEEMYRKIEQHLMAILIIDGNSKKFDKAVQTIAPEIHISRFIRDTKKLERAKEEAFQRTLVNHIATHLPARTLAIEKPKLIYPNVWTLIESEHRMRMSQSARLDASEILALQAAGKSTDTYFDNKRADELYIESVYKRISEHNERILTKPPAPSKLPVTTEKSTITFREPIHTHNLDDPEVVSLSSDSSGISSSDSPPRQPSPSVESVIGSLNQYQDQDHDQENTNHLDETEVHLPMPHSPEAKSWLLRLFIWFLELIQTKPSLPLIESHDTPSKYYTFDDSFDDVDEPPVDATPTTNALPTLQEDSSPPRNSARPF